MDFALVGHHSYGLIRHRGCYRLVDLVVIVGDWDWEAGLVLLVVGAF